MAAADQRDREMAEYLADNQVAARLTAADEPQTVATTEAHAAAALREEITLAMAQLPSRQRIALEYFHEQSLSYTEIADRMECPLGTVKTLVHRARQSLIAQLHERDVLPKRQADSVSTSTGEMR